MPTSSAEPSGFTLLELLVVLTVVGLVVATAIPHMGRSSETLDVRKASTTIASVLTNARDKALATGRPSMVTVAPARRMLIDDDRRSTTLEPSLTLAVPGAPGSVVLRFFPDGSASDAVIHVSSGPALAKVSVDGMTGRIER